MVKSFYTPQGSRIPDTLKSLASSIKDIQRPTGTEKERVILNLQTQVVDLEAAVAELSARTTYTTSPEDFTISTDTPNEFPTATRDFSFPAPEGGGRVATLALSGEFVRVSSSGSITIWLEILQNGVVTWRRTGAFYIGDPASAPPAWGNPAINDFISLRVPNAASANMQIRLYASTFVAGNVVARMQNIQATLEYGPRS